MNFNRFMNDVASLIDAVLLTQTNDAVIRYDGKEVISGYLVALQGHERAFPIVEYVGDYESLVHSILCHASDGYRYGQGTSDGVRLSLHGGHLYLERVFHVGDEETALALAHYNDKQAIYHIDTDAEIRL
jgi:hypothetical protein